MSQRNHNWFAYLVVIMAVTLLPRQAGAQTPVDFFGLSGSRMTHFEKNDARREREQVRGDIRRRKQIAGEDLKRLREFRLKGSLDSTKAKTLVDDSTAVVKANADLRQWAKANRFEVEKEDSTKRASAAQLPLLPAFDVVTELAGEGEGENRAITTGRSLYDVPFSGATNTHLTVFGNVGGIINATSTTPPDTLLAAANELRSSRTGLHLGMALWYLLNSREGNASWVPNLFMGGRSNRVNTQDTNETITLNQFQAGAAISLGLGYIEGQNHPLGLSLGTVCNFFSAEQYARVFGVKRSTRWDGHMTLLVPIASSGVGILFEDTISQGASPLWHVGVVFTGNKEPEKKPGT